MAVELANVSLGIGGGEMDGNIHTAVDRLGILAGMDGVGGKARVFVGEVLSFSELIVLDFRFFLFVEHVDINYLSHNKNIFFL